MFQPGRVWNDVAGKPIEAHIGGILFHEGVYYWYGTNFDGPTIPPKTLPRQGYSWILNRGIAIYASTDLEHWERRGDALAEVQYAPGSLLQPLNALIRPKVIRNDRTGKFILMAALIAPDIDAFNDVVYAVADAPAGPFEFRGMLGWQGVPNRSGIWNRCWPAAAGDPPERIRGFDMGLFKDADGKAYLMTAHEDVYLYELSDDYQSVRSVQLMEGAAGEAPALFHAGGRITW